MMQQLFDFPLILILFCVLPLIIVEWFFPLLKYEFDTLWLVRLLIYAFFGIILTSFIGDYLTNKNHISLFNQLHIDLFYQYPIVVQSIIGYLLITFFIYWWHRLRHQSNFLWRTFHQIHHSTYRIQTLTAIYAHPLDFIGTALVVNSVIYLILGLHLKAAVLTTVITSFFDFWEHTNIKTPKWLGYILVRPEMHRIHHEKNKHNNNYSIPLWDMIFGTYENSNREVVCGFDIEHEKQVLRLLTFHDLDKK
ncbi:MAG: sterol desaturase family protein [Betaproteobacteria bacterium]|nr:sterol desaturase family protein [Betaproteobacteria bacterium]